jgi:response regulator NasT
MTSTNSLRIIIADDEAVIRMGLQTMLGSLNHRVIATARDGSSAILKVKQLKPDLLLMDIKMPGMDGLAAAEILAKEAPLPIVMLTAYSQRELVERAVQASVMGYLVKPIDEKQLSPTISLAIARYKEAEDAASELDQLRARLAGRNLVERAKRKMVEQGLSENEAYHRLQAAARKRQISMAEMAERILKRNRVL